MQNLAPIIIFAYNRPNHLASTLNGLMNCDSFFKSRIIIYFDGPKNDKDNELVEKTRAIAKEILSNRAEYRYGKVNRGLAASIISGVSDTVSRYGRVIVVEDDLLVSPYFLDYMNEGLSLYKDDESVASIHGYLYPISCNLPETFFLRGANCWGWATWQRAWVKFETNGSLLLKELKNKKLESSFDLDNSYPYYRMLKDQIRGRNNSWAVRWHASTFLLNMYTLYPGRTLVENIGMDGSGEHCKQNIPILPLANSPIIVKRISIEENGLARQALIKYMRFLRIYLWRGRFLMIGDKFFSWFRFN